LGSTLGFFKGFNEGRFGDCSDLGSKGMHLGFLKRVELGQIRALFWGSKGVHLGFFFKGLNEGRLGDCFGAQRGCIRDFFKGLNEGRLGDCFGAQRGCIWFLNCFQ
jgi:hypothetical protein